MKINIIISVLHLFLISSCQGTTIIEKESKVETKSNVELTAENNDIKPIKLSHVYKYKINNTDSKQFGFLSVQEDQSIGVRGMFLLNDFVFFTDPLHGNIKKINLKDGEITNVSSQLDIKNSLRAITVFNNTLYVLTDNETIFMLDLSLNKTRQLFVPKYRWVKDILNQTESELTLFRPIEDVIQQVDRSMKIKVIKIDTANFIKSDSLLLNYDDYTKSYGTSNIRGKQYSYLNEGVNHFLITEYGKFELKEKLPSTYKYYDAKNIDFSVNRVIYFSVTPDEIIITVNDY